ncbi:MAG: WYL domain-containing protein, partial [Bacteroidales bacterium]|nr:WYL domain-containing protein [Bacteroidales bacterium]
RNKTFKISRIGGEVEVLDETWANEEKHHRSSMDIFRTTGEEPEHIVLRMSLLAKNLLEEEYPMAAKYISKGKDGWILETDIYQMRGVARFVAGLMGEISILEGSRLMDYMKEYGHKYFCE